MSNQEVPPLETTDISSNQDLECHELEMETNLEVKTNLELEGEPEIREHWDTKIEYLLSVIGFAVDLGNIYRFPYICYQNGGGAFLIPYIAMYILVGFPMFYLELCVGQFHQSGCITLWDKICPILKGVGYTIVVLNLFMQSYYNMTMCWAIMMMTQSFQSPLPWSECNPLWATSNCSSWAKIKQINSANNTSNQRTHTTAAFEYFFRGLLRSHESNGLENLGSLFWKPAVTLLFLFFLYYGILFKGIKSSGKVVYVSATVPYIVLVILMVRSSLFDGAKDGLYYYVVPEFSKLLKLDVWFSAAIQVFFSLGPGFGVLITFSSFNKKSNNCFSDAIICSLINCLTSFMCGFVVFATLGYMANMLNEKVSDLKSMEGPSLMFIAFPEAINTLSGAPFFAVILFLMIISLGIDSTFAGYEAVLTALTDAYPILNQHKHIFLTIIMSFCYLISLPSATYGGYFYYHFLDNILAPYIVPLVTFFELIALLWIYDHRKLSSDIASMLGEAPHMAWIIMWKFITPICIFLIVFGMWFTFDGVPSANNYFYPTWSSYLVFVIVSFILCPIPVMMVYTIFIQKGTLKQRFLASLIGTSSMHTVKVSPNTEDIDLDISLKFF